MADNRFMPKIVTDENGREVSSSYRESWLKARLLGVTATEAGKILAGGSARDRLMQVKLGLLSDNFKPNDYMKHGIEREPFIAAFIEKEFGTNANNNLFHHDENKNHLATPDGIGFDFVVEIKASINSLDENLKRYYQQLQWQMYVMNVDSCLFVVEHHIDFKPYSIKTTWVNRDEAHISKMISAADIFLDELKMNKDR